MFLGIEIGGTKLQLGVGRGDGGPLVALERREVDPQHGAAGILAAIESAGLGLLQQHRVERIGIGFGGPVDARRGRVTKSHHVEGWTDFPLAEWCGAVFHAPAALGNDCDAAALAEARWGAGRGRGRVFYVTVGSGVGGGFVVDGRLDGADRPAIAEIGHLRPGLLADRPEATVESLASGWGIAAAAQARVTGGVSRPVTSLLQSPGAGGKRDVQRRLADAEQTDREFLADLVQRAGGDPEGITARHVAQAAAEGNEIARELLGQSTRALGWALATAITLLAPEAVVVGGGVSLAGEQLFLAPLREEVRRYVFPPLLGSYEILPAALGELAVVHGAMALAGEAERETLNAER